jgi:hypothetical protein
VAPAASPSPLPEIEGIETFQGEIFHSARWNHDVDLAGKRVAVIGTGASRSRSSPSCRRSPPPRRLPAHRAVDHPAQRPALHPLERSASAGSPGCSAPTAGVYCSLEGRVPAFTARPKLAEGPEGRRRSLNIAKAHQGPRAARRSPRLRDRLQADPDLQQLLPRPRRRQRRPGHRPDRQGHRHAIVTADGVERPIDVLVVATGFYTTDLPIAEHITGRDGRTLADRGARRDGGVQGHHRPGFPNLFQLVGPNTGLGHTSMVFIIESQVAYVATRSRTDAPRGLAAVEPTRRAQDPGTTPAGRMKPTVWTDRRLRELVPRRARQQHHPVAQVHRSRSASTLSQFDLDAYDVTPAEPLTDQEEGPA